ncbi:hypothetical protein GQX73_g4076 [Xylaria multiplex]|uniref:N-acetyltransferase domain-containing protein n=1 Tax=Xylaria multiplex TaxID=323545 RepID=A0A7C8IQ68_9PEZI|nr:hypothetical protein GQX73_g4076 [Xylaria multiplex]
MAPEVTVYTAPPEALVELLARSHFLQGLPLIRRLRQSAEGEELAGKRDGVEKTTKEAVEVPFAAAYLDFSRGPETELWIYSSMERGSEKGTGREEEEPDDGGEGIACAVSLLREVKHQQDLYFTPGSARASTREFPTVLVGNLNEVLRKRLAAPGAGMAIVSTGLYDKWIFKVTELPDVALPETLGDGRRWAWRAVRREDIPFMLSRSKIDRKERTVKLLPSTALYLDDGTPVAWAFLGPDSSLSSLHCEESYRGRGIAKAVAVKVLKDHLRDYSDEPYGWADVALDNIQSQGVCKSLHGQVGWQISWSRLNLDESFPRE